MENPVWFDTKVSHKAIYVGPARMPVALCKLAFREFWPPDGCADLNDICRRNWAEVECFQCTAFAPEIEKLDLLRGAICWPCAKKRKLRWPKGHCATSSYMQCDFCFQDNVAVCSTGDWLHPGEKEIPAGRWD